MRVVVCGVHAACVKPSMCGYKTLMFSLCTYKCIPQLGVNTIINIGFLTLGVCTDGYFRNVGKYLPSYASQYPRKCRSQVRMIRFTFLWNVMS